MYNKRSTVFAICLLLSGQIFGFTSNGKYLNLGSLGIYASIYGIKSKCALHVLYGVSVLVFHTYIHGSNVYIGTPARQIKINCCKCSYLMTFHLSFAFIHSYTHITRYTSHIISKQIFSHKKLVDVMCNYARSTNWLNCLFILCQEYIDGRGISDWRWWWCCKCF